MSSYADPGPAYRPEFFIKNIVESCNRAGICLIASGDGLHAYPPRVLQRHAGLLLLVRRHRYAVMCYLDSLLE